MSSASPLPTSCSRCGAVASGHLGVCLRCAARRLLAVEDGEGAHFDPTPALAPAPGIDPSPEHIGPYAVIEEIGRGGMGRVYAAQHHSLGRIVALKLMGVGGAIDPGLELRFQREAQTAARLRHPNIVPLHDYGQADGRFYFSMEYMDGGDLSARLRQRAFSAWESADMIRKVALALAYAHGQGVLHRDLKPSNILLDGDEPRLADFGLAAQLEPGGDLTAVTGVLGTPHYLAPEALRRGSGALTIRSDIYALGVILFEMLTGRTPFAGTAPAALALLVSESEPPSPRLLSPSTPRDLETICLKCLERDPERRYSDAAALAEDLRRFLDAEPILARSISPAGRFVRWCRRRPALALVWALVSTLAVSSTIAAIWIRAERANTLSALGKARTAETEAREQLRQARLAEATAVLRTTQPGRRKQALQALSDAAKIRLGADLRDVALTALTIPDVSIQDSWRLNLSGPMECSPTPGADIIATEEPSPLGVGRGAASFWRRGEAKPFARLEVSGSSVVGPIRFSRDGKRAMARYKDAALRVWKVGEAAPFLTLTGRPAPGDGSYVEMYNDDYDFGPDGKTLAVGLPAKGISLHSVESGAELARWEGGARFNRLRISPDGRRLAALNDIAPEAREFYILDLPEMKLARRVELASRPRSVAWSSDSRVAAVAMSDSSIFLYDGVMDRPIDRLPAAHRNPSEVAFLAHDSLVAVRGTGSRLHIVNTALGREELVVEGLGPGSSSVAVGPDSGETFAFASLFFKFNRWRVDSPVGWKMIPGGTSDVLFGAYNNDCMDFTADSRIVFASYGRYLLARDVESGRFLGRMDAGPPANGFERAALALTRGGRALVRTSNLTGTWLIDLDFRADGLVDFKNKRCIDPEPGFLMTDRARSGGLLAMADLEREMVKIVEIGSDGSVKVVGRWETPGPYTVALSPDGTEALVTGSGSGSRAAEQRIKLWRISGPSLIKDFGIRSAGEAAWSAVGGVALTSNSQEESTLWNTKDWSIRATLKGDLAGNTTAFALSPDGSIAVITSNDRLHLVRTSDGERICGLTCPNVNGLAAGIRYLPDGRRFAVAWVDGRIDIIDPDALNRGLAPLGLAWASSR